MERWGSYRGGEGALLDMKPCSGSDWSCFLADPGPAEPHLLIRARWWELILVVWFICEARRKSTLLVSFDSPCLSCVCVCVRVSHCHKHIWAPAQVTSRGHCEDCGLPLSPARCSCASLKVVQIYLEPFEEVLKDLLCVVWWGFVRPVCALPVRTGTLCVRSPLPPGVRVHVVTQIKGLGLD